LVSIGRSTGSTIVLELDDVSRRHCSLVCRPNGVWLRDEQSTNGTLLNLVGVEPKAETLLRYDDEFTVGSAIFKLVSGKNLDRQQSNNAGHKVVWLEDERHHALGGAFASPIASTVAESSKPQVPNRNLTEESTALRPGRPDTAADVPATSKRRSACPACNRKVSTTARRCRSCGAALTTMKYRIAEVLAETGHSRVYRATDPAGTVVALKELAFAFAPDAKAIDSFEREAAVLKKLRHPGIPRFLNYFTDGKGVGLRLYLVQEFIAGKTLSDVVTSARLGTKEALRLGRALLAIVEYLHGLSPPLIHRDIKPGNIVLRGDGRIVLVDFGIAREVRVGGTHNATIVSGSSGYAPPEQYAGTASERTDLYAIGATLVHALTGRDPHDVWTFGDTPRLERTLSAPLPFVRLLESLLQPQAAHRPATAQVAMSATEGARKVWMVFNSTGALDGISVL
jgi:hypothetical protein